MNRVLPKLFQQYSWTSFLWSFTMEVIVVSLPCIIDIKWDAMCNMLLYDL